MLCRRCEATPLPSGIKRGGNGWCAGSPEERRLHNIFVLVRNSVYGKVVA